MKLDKEAYRRFLKSGFWICLRREKLKINPACQHCGMKNNLQCHHLFYRDDWYKTQIEDLKTLCEQCHNFEHGKGRPERKNKKHKIPAWRREQIRISRKRNPWSF